MKIDENIGFCHGLLGEDTRYDGLNSSIALNPKYEIFTKRTFYGYYVAKMTFLFALKLQVVSAIPRNKAEIKSHNKPFMEIDEKENDVTINFLIGAKKSS